MSTEERNSWISLVTTAAVAAVYFAVIALRARSTPVAEVEWIAPMAWAIGAIVVITIVAAIAAAIAGEVASEIRSEIRGRKDPENADRGRSGRKVDADERDRRIVRHGDYWAGQVAAAGVLVAIVVTMLGLDRFWIANALFATIVLSGICGGVIKSLAYRRGI